MATCDECGKQENMPYECRRCGGSFCAEHRLPENHDCPGLEWDDPVGVFNQAEERDTSTGRGGGLGVRERARSLWRSYVRNNATFVLLLLMWVTWVIQLGLRAFGMDGVESALFVLQSSHPEYVWTWVTSVFAHGGIVHIAANSIGIFFFGQVVERRIGTKRFVGLFLVSGAAAGLAQIGATMLLVGPNVSVGVLGASGALLAIMGVLTILNPGLTVYLYFFIPVPIWLLTIGFAAFSLLSGFGAFQGGGNVAHWAHLAGLAIGLVYGTYIQGQVDPPQRLQFGGGGGPGRGGGRF
ncbi:rhomboid family intramembrane serine protease [Halolamina sp. CBA1230]|uniref:rhomboid family intramembrane serine protease n=1 Tax=Halolamina sp. CBA1230 TaxID=1853690 RepID=UPI0009A1A30A|nr:rhomboid family intramembrane serine protease [Halolamina sp. CBA1230]QKY21389.1 rhomboid family intramembrane serine protease [Halolamina sp. CBA1230]